MSILADCNHSQKKTSAVTRFEADSVVVIVRANEYRMGQTDSAFYALNLADSFYVCATNPRGQIRVILGKLDAKADIPDSLPNVLFQFVEIKKRKSPAICSLATIWGMRKICIWPVRPASCSPDII